ncbi:MAG: carboxypeptidase regulatory-like domain-containing protein [Vicinamibacterales bacterium]
MRRSWRLSTIVPIVLTLLAVPAFGQVYQGRIEVTVVDPSGSVLPGVTVTIAGPQNTTAVTDARGEVRFLNLPTGTYSVTSVLSGFVDYSNSDVQVVAGGSVNLKVPMRLAGVQETVSVSAETPVIDIRRQTTQTNVTLEELQNIPSARDPWVVMQSVPSIVVDRVNVGGSESGQQSNFTAKGAQRGDATWNVDGVPVTDMSATGATSTYFDFDAFQEISITTGGADVTSATPGVQLNFAMKTGSDTPHGSARTYFENESLQSNNMPADLAAAIGGASGKGNRTDQYADYGFDVGGPIMKGKWWAWGSYGKTDVRIRTLTDVLDRTILENYAFKSQAQLSDTWRPSFMYFRGDKLKYGRGASATHPDETTWNQSGPTSIYKGDLSFTKQNLYVVGRYAYADMGFTLDPRGGLGSGDEVYQDDDGVWHNSYVYYSTKRPQKTANIDANYFAGRHEFKFGYAYRKFPVDSISQWPGSKIITYHVGYPDLYVKVARDTKQKTEGNYQNFYAGDTITLDRATINVGFRWDYQTSSLLANSVEGVSGFPLLASISAPAVNNAVKWSNITPRLGITYSLTEDRRTQVRASYSEFASQLSASQASFINPVGYSYIYYNGIDRNGDNVAQYDEILFSDGLQYSYGIDPDNPTKTESTNRIGDVNAPKTREVILGVDRELGRNFGVSASYTYRYINQVTWTPLIGVRSPQFTQVNTLSGNSPETGSYSIPLYGLPAALTPVGNGREFENRDQYHQRFQGLEVSATKRLSNRWMMRVGFSTNSHTEYFDDRNVSIEDPNPNPRSTPANSPGPLVDGGQVIQRSAGSGKSEIYLIVPKYQFIANGLYQGPFGINFGANYVARQGYGQPWFESNVSVGDQLGRRRVLLTKDIGGDRLPTVHSVDVRVEKAFQIKTSNLYLDLDVFNLGNAATVLGRQFDHRFAATSATGFGRTLEIMNPRIARLGIRFTF